MLGQWLYLEFLIPIKDYLTTLKLREFCFDWLFPLFVSITSYLMILLPGTYTEDTNEFVNQVLTVLSVLFGFSIASMTLLITSGSENVIRLQNYIAENRKISGRAVNVYQLTIITFTFLLFLEMFGLLVNFAYLLAASLDTSLRDSLWRVFYAIDCFLLIQVIALNIRNTTNIYFVFLANRPGRNPRA